MLGVMRSYVVKENAETEENHYPVTCLDPDLNADKQVC